MYKKNLTIIFVIVILLALIFVLQKRQQPQNNQPANSANVYTPDRATKISSCQAASGLPDHACTPGAINTDVTQSNIQFTICTTGFTKTMRPPASYTDNLKRQQMISYNDTGSAKNYEEDHLIPLELGGNPTDPANLWPESYSPYPGAHEKDRVENYLHQQVCEGDMTLAEAQKEIATNWEQVYNSVPEIGSY